LPHFGAPPIRPTDPSPHNGSTSQAGSLAGRSGRSQARTTRNAWFMDPQFVEEIAWQEMSLIDHQDGTELLHA
jgi:hypothetical protein